MTNILVLLAVGLIIGCAVGYIYKEKKKGVNCIGCPDSTKCGGNCAGCSGNCCGMNGAK